MDLDWADLFKKLTQEIDQTGKAYAEAKANSWYAQEMKSALLSKLMNSYGDDIPVSRAEIKAKASDDYSKFLVESRILMELEGKTKSSYEKAKARFDAYRSLCSLEKKTRTLIEGD